MTITMNTRDGKNGTADALERKIVEIPREKVKINPNNIRRSYDQAKIEELARSIEANGVLQALTVSADPEREGEFLVVAGNRRKLASDIAGLPTLPCEIRTMEAADQCIAMLNENMQRENLTLTEEAGGMQMCLTDFGMDAKELAGKVGLSETTVRHRLNVAKLDQDVLKEKEADEGFQLSLADLAKLEKIRSIKKRNEILSHARNSRDLASRALSVSNEEKRKKSEKGYTALMEREGIRPLPEDAKSGLYTDRWEKLAEFPLEGKAPESITVTDGDGNIVSRGSIYYTVKWRTIEIVRRAKKVKKELTEEEKAERAVRKARREHRAVYKEMLALMGDFYRGIASGKIKRIKAKEAAELKERMWGIMMQKHADVSLFNVTLVTAEGDYWDLDDDGRKAAEERAGGLPTHLQMLGILLREMKGVELMTRDGRYSAFAADIFRQVYGCFGTFGFSFTDAEQLAVMDGTHGLYAAGGPEEEASAVPDGTDSAAGTAAGDGTDALPEGFVDAEEDGGEIPFEDAQAAARDIILTDTAQEVA